MSATEVLQPLLKGLGGRVTAAHKPTVPALPLDTWFTFASGRVTRLCDLCPGHATI